MSALKSKWIIVTSVAVIIVLAGARLRHQSGGWRMIWTKKYVEGSFPARTFTPHSACVTLVSEQVAVLDALSGTTNRTLTANKATVRTLCWPRKGKLLFDGTDDGKLCVWNLDNFRESTLTAGYGKLTHITCTSFRCDGDMLAIGTDDGDVSMWDLRTLKCVSRLPHHRGGI